MAFLGSLFLVYIKMWLCLLIFTTGESCPIPEFLHGEYFSLEQGDQRNTVITNTTFENEAFEGECNQTEQIQNTISAGTYDVRILLYSR